MAKHTPGPWRAEGRYVMAQKVKTVAEVPCGGVHHGHVDAANARLIAAAPDMYDLLDSLHADLARYAKMTEGAWSSGSIAFDSMASDISRVLAKAREEHGGER